MKKKHLFSAVALAAVFAGCSQDELIGESNMQTIGNRPMVEAPSITLEGTDTRMTTNGDFAGVTWQAGDGFGACVIDKFDNTKTLWEQQFPIVDYISSNVLYKTTDGVKFSAEASLCQGNFLFYAPFNEANFKRGPLAVQLPTEQIVVPSTTDKPSNTAIQNFYEAKKYPVFVAYDSIWKTPKTELSLKMKHIYSLPRITLKLGNVQLLDSKGNLKKDTNGNPIYETSITIDSIKFKSKDIVTSGTITNEDIIKHIAKDSKGNVAWDINKYETAATSDIVKKVGDNKEICVKFNPAMTISADKKGDFFMVLPGADYTKAKLAIEVYTTINNEDYVLAASSLAQQVKTIEPARDLRLLPGLPYSADEYNKDGSMKESKGTSATYTVDGGFIPAKTAIASGYTQIKNYDELTTYIQKVAYRGEPLIEITKDMADAYMTASGIVPDPKKYFVITATAEAPIALDDKFLTEFDNSCVITNGDASIAFAPDSKLVTLGNITFNVKETPVMFNAGTLTHNGGTDNYAPATLTNTTNYVSGNAILTGGDATAKFGSLTVNKGASLTLDKDMVATGIIVKNNDGTITSASTAKELTITNTKGTAIVNASPMVNTGTKSVIANSGTLTINTSILDTNVELTNNADAEATVNGKTSVTFATNDGLVKVNNIAANVTITNGTGKVDNTIGGKIKNTANTVFATLGAMTNAEELAKYDAYSGLNTLNLTGEWTVSNQTGATAIETIFATNGALATVKTINFNAGSGMTVGGSTTLDFTTKAITAININADVTWTGRIESSSKIIATNLIKLTTKPGSSDNYTLTEIDITVTKLP